LPLRARSEATSLQEVQDMAGWRSRVRGAAALALFIVSAVAIAVPRGAGTSYVVTDLGTFGNVQSAQALELNEAGQVVGYAAGRAFLWQNGAKRDLGTLGGPSATANALNEAGQVVGHATFATLSQTRAVLWNNGGIVNLTPELAATEFSSASGINESGQVVGNIGYGIAFLWQNGVRTPLGDLGGGYGNAPQDINNAGQIVGSASVVTELGPTAHAFLWENGTMTDLGVLPGDEDSGASAINNHGVIVGSTGRTDMDTYEQFYKPFVYEDGQMRPIPVPGTESFAGDINDGGDVVGTMRAGGAVTPWHAWIYKDGVVTNLNSVKPTGSGLHLAFANAINNQGQIAGVAMDAQGRYHAFLLTPGGPPPGVVPTMRINDASVLEGKSGTTAATFTVSLSEATTNTILVNFITQNGTAIAGNDYNFANGTLTFNPGETSKTITVAVKGDRTREADETFRVILSNADGATIFDGTGSGIIHNDDR
jgi:probable HAF family extracellular repeat protein